MAQKTELTFEDSTHDRVANALKKMTGKDSLGDSLKDLIKIHVMNIEESELRRELEVEFDSKFKDKKQELNDLL